MPQGFCTCSRSYQIHNRDNEESLRRCKLENRVFDALTAKGCATVALSCNENGARHQARAYCRSEQRICRWYSREKSAPVVAKYVLQLLFVVGLETSLETCRSSF